MSLARSDPSSDVEDVEGIESPPPRLRLPTTPHPRQPHILCHTSHAWMSGNITDLAKYLGMPPLTVPEWLHLVFPAQTASFGHMLFQGMLQ